MKIVASHFVLALTLLGRHSQTFAEIFTSIVHLELLLKPEAALLEALNNYIASTEVNLITLRRLARQLEDQHDTAKSDIKKSVENPLTAYLFVKRFSKEWQYVSAMMSNDTQRDIIKDILNSTTGKYVVPTAEDIYGAAISLVRIQETYNLNMALFANGHIAGTQTSAELSSLDCFEIGCHIMKKCGYELALNWFNYAELKYHREINKTARRDTLLEHIAHVMYKLGYIETAINKSLESLKFNPNYKNSQKNLRVYLEANHTRTIKHLKGDDGRERMYITASPQPLVLPQTVKSFNQLSLNNQFESICRGEFLISKSEQAQLKCRYVSKRHPFTRLARFKEEEAHLDPKVLIYHDVIYDKEIAQIMETSVPLLKRATTMTHTKSEVRVAKVAWLAVDRYKYLSQLKQRSEDITELTLRKAEPFQVVNYGIGGYYGPHCDHGNSTQENRVATLLYYMHDVQQGGDTVFTNLRIANKAKKGTAIFWHNLHSDGLGDGRTTHGSCPVSIGAKWIINVWINKTEQIFHRPCGLSGASGSSHFDYCLSHSKYYKCN